MKYKIGKVEGGLPQKFIVACERESGEPKSLVYYAISRFAPEFDGSIKHADIAAEYSVKPMGGGMVSGNGARLRLYGKSRDYGGVSERILRRFKTKLLEEYRKILPDIRDIEISSDGVDEPFWDQFDKDET